jgi:hypothetical protein
MARAPSHPRDPERGLGAKAGPHAPTSSQYLRDLAVMRLGEASQPSGSVAGMISNGGQSSLAAPESSSSKSEPSQPLVPFSPAELDDGTIILEGEIALRRILSVENCYPDWRAIGLAVLVGRRICMREAQVKRPHGIKYCRLFRAWLSEHHFDEITETTRKCACLIAKPLGTSVSAVKPEKGNVRIGSWSCENVETRDVNARRRLPSVGTIPFRLRM